MPARSRFASFRGCGPAAALALSLLFSASACSVLDAAFGESEGRDIFCTDNVCWYEEEYDLQALGQIDHVAIAVLDGDGIPDILAARSEGAIVALFADGGTFQEPQPYVELGDEMIFDIATSNEWNFAVGTPPLLAITRSTEITIMDSTGAVSNVAASNGPGPLAIGDFDGDGLADVAVGHGDGDISILLQAADFQPSSTSLRSSTGDGGVRALAVGRFESTGGCHDLAAAQIDGSDNALATYFFCHSPAPLFSEQRGFGDPTFPQALGAGPMSGGAQDELVIGTGCMGNCEAYDLLRVHDEQGSYQNSFVHGGLTSGTFELQEMIVGDFDRQDGTDVVMVGDGHGSGPTVIMGFGADLSASGSGFDVLQGIDLDGTASAVAAGDLNGDRRQDFVIGQPDGRLRVLLSYSK